MCVPREKALKQLNVNRQTRATKPRLYRIADLSTKLPTTRAYRGCYWLYLCKNSDDTEGKVEAISMWESRELYQAYLDWCEASGELRELETNYYAADPVWKYMPVLMDFNK